MMFTSKHTYTPTHTRRIVFFGGTLNTAEDTRLPERITTPVCYYGKYGIILYTYKYYKYYVMISL